MLQTANQNVLSTTIRIHGKEKMSPVDFMNKWWNLYICDLAGWRKSEPLIENQFQINLTLLHSQYTPRKHAHTQMYTNTWHNTSIQRKSCNSRGLLSILGLTDATNIRHTGLLWWCCSQMGFLCRQRKYRCIHGRPSTGIPKRHFRISFRLPK